jgi:YD repeat-containing protein
MSTKTRHALLISMTMIALLFATVIVSYAETINYIYDELNRLKRVEYGDGTVVEYTYDKAGNRLEKTIQMPDTTPPTTTASPAGGPYNTAQTVTLTCNDGGGSGCDKIYYTTDGNDPTTSSPVYSSPINIPVTTTLKFFAKDLASNSEAVKTEIYTIDTIAPTTTASPAGGTYNSAQSVTLSCSDGSGSGCDKIYYTTDGTTPTTSSPVYSAPINISIATYLKFFSKDWAGNSEPVRTETYFINTGGGCSNFPVKIGSTFYSTLQSAYYNAAVNGDIIKCRNLTFIENLTVNRDIGVILDGGYDCGFTTNVGGRTTIKGMLTTTAGGGTITIKNFILGN